MKFISKIFNAIFLRNTPGYYQNDVKSSVSAAIDEYKGTLKDLEDYDKGKEPDSYRLVRNKPVQTYLRDLQRTFN